MSQSTSCHAVAAQLELYALGECAEPERTVIRQHLDQCPVCGQAHAEAQRLFGLLDLKFQEPQRLRRLYARIDAEDRRQRAPLRLLPLARRVGTLAALLLLALGLSRWLAPRLAPDETQVHLLGTLQAQLLLAKLEVKAQRGPPEQVPDAVPAAKNERWAMKNIRLPPPVELALQLRNDGDQEREVWLSGEYTQLTLSLRAPDGKRVATWTSVTGPAKEAKKQVLAPGETRTLRFSSGAYQYQGVFAEGPESPPGEYRLTARFRTAVRPAPSGAVPAGDGFGSLTVLSPPIRIPVEPAK